MEYNELRYITHRPERKDYWSNGMIAFGPEPRTKRQTPCYLGKGCHDKEHIGWISDCGKGTHKWELNFYRSPDGPNHYHCFYCGIGHDLDSMYTRWPFREVLKVPKDWIEKLEEWDGT